MQYERRGRRGGRNFGPSRFAPKPVEIGKEYDVEILETSRRGEGIARIKGLVCFVPKAKPGDHVRVRVTKISSRFAEAEVVGEAGEKAPEEETEETEKTEKTEAATEEEGEVAEESEETEEDEETEDEETE